MSRAGLEPAHYIFQSVSMDPKNLRSTMPGFPNLLPPVPWITRFPKTSTLPPPSYPQQPTAGPPLPAPPASRSGTNLHVRVKSEIGNHDPAPPSAKRPWRIPRCRSKTAFPALFCAWKLALPFFYVSANTQLIGFVRQKMNYGYLVHRFSPSTSAPQSDTHRTTRGNHETCAPA